MFNIQLNKSLDIPLYIQISEHIRDLIVNDKLQNPKLPSIRDLAKKLDVNNVTIVNAYRLLEQEGYVYPVKGSGTYIKNIPNQLDLSYLEEGDMELMVSGILPMTKDSINFATVSPTHSLFPIEEFKKSLVEVLDRDGGLAFLYPEVSGYGPLRESISKFLLMNYNTIVGKEQILITSGGQQGLDIICKTLINNGDSILVENPTYSGALAIFNSRGARIKGIPMMKDGINIRQLELAIRKEKPKFLYIMTNYQNPTTYSYSEKKKVQLLELADKYDFLIIEDDFLTDLNFDEIRRFPLKSMDKNDRVIFIKSFSKIFMPGVRIGFLTLPGNLYKDIIKAKHTTDISSSGFLQRAFDQYLKIGYWKNYIRDVKEVYKRKYDLITSRIDRLKTYGLTYIPPSGGLSLWVKLPKEIDAIDLYQDCNEKKLSIVPGRVFFVNDGINSNYIRLSFGSVDDHDIRKGMDIFENIIKSKFIENTNEYMPFV